ncbi:ribonuclease R [Peptoniphilus sp. oral taxon 386]|uniref:ribonuclease R n=1 Tax=Peptoniphilus sp. oral taxon 386 TaxID=652713 RepID=UPI0001DA9ED4|nr:ribonuclease R [Peptoniphilus sp. oral taxon 386]EFI41514.1 ribonuclease R [Peptoniphilus sp. oral taxon 386 str. F0131]
MIKEKIFESIKDRAPMTKEQIAKLFEIKNKEKSEFYKLLQKLENDGLLFLLDHKYIAIDNKRYRYGKVQGNEKGFGFLLQDDEDVFISENNMNSALNGDEVVVKVLDRKAGDSIEGKIILIVKRANEKVVGTFQNCQKFGFVVPDDNKISFDIFVSKKDFLGAKDGQKVLVKIEKWPEKNKKPEGKIIKIFGYEGEKEVDILSIAASLNLPMEFSNSALSLAKSIPTFVAEKDLKDRLDLRDITTFTIDGADSKDFDDAVSIEKLENGGYRLGVHIADVSHYVKESDEIDKNAYERGNSVYLIDKVIPMLPEELSNGICSLNEGVDRLTLSVMINLDNNAKVIEHQIVPAVIRSSKRLIYDNVSDLIEKNIVDESVLNIKDDLLLMNELALKLRKRRMDRGSIDFDFPEAKITVDNNGRPTDIIREERRSANKLIEEFMLLCNETVAEQYFWMELPFIYRIHEEPDEEKIESLNKILRHLGLKLNTQNLDSKEVQSLIEKVKGKEFELFVSTLILRSMKKARYSEQNDIHFGLAAKYYSHFTSPIRRYADLTIHRIIKDSIKNKLTTGRINYFENVLSDFAKHISATERLAQDAERMVESVKMAEYMSDRIGEEYPAILSSITSFGMFAQLENTIEGLISYQSLSDYFEYNEEEYSAVGRDTGKVYNIGDKITVKVVNTNITRGTIDFEIVGDENGKEC